MGLVEKKENVSRAVAAALEDKVAQNEINLSIFCDDVESAKYGLTLEHFMEAVANAVFSHATDENLTPLPSIAIGEIGEESNYRGTAVQEFKVELGRLSKRF